MVSAVAALPHSNYYPSSSSPTEHEEANDVVSSQTMNDVANADVGILYSPPLPSVSPAVTIGGVTAVAIANHSHGGEKKEEGDDDPREKYFSGISGSSSSRVLQTQVCTQGFVDCVNGFVNGSPSTRCEIACGGNCCKAPSIYSLACWHFTGKICKDGSCYGFASCYRATIPLVVNSCKGSQKSCYRANIPSVVNSCNGGAAECYRAGQAPSLGVGNMINSCHGDQACEDIAREGGSIGSLTNSCKASQACRRAGKTAVGAITSNLNDCCNTPSGCLNAMQSSIPGICSAVVRRDNMFLITFVNWYHEY